MDIFRLTNEELIRLTEELASDLRAKTCELVESLAEIDRRRLYRDFQCVSLFEYCVTRLRMSEAASYRRIRAARAFGTYPPVKPLLRSGKLTLESLALLHPFLNDADAGKLVAEASGKRVWEVERLIAGRRTEAPRRDVVRFAAPGPAAALPDHRLAAEELFEGPMAARSAAAPAAPAAELPAMSSAPAATPAVVPAPLTTPVPAPVPAGLPEEPANTPAENVDPAPARQPCRPDRRAVRIGFTTDEAFFNLLKEAQAALRHKYPDGRLDGVFRDALVALLRKKRPWAFPRTRAVTS